MNNIIQDAKKFLKLVDEERADLESRGAEPDEYGGFEMWLDSTVLYDNAKEVREAITELAEETWEYTVQEKWLTPLGSVWRLATEAQWYSSYRAAEESADPECHTRIVRRRVSPPEVIND